jgi:hypothetical protein
MRKCTACERRFIYEIVPLRIVDPCDSGQLIKRQSRREVATFQRLRGFRVKVICEIDQGRSESHLMKSLQNTSIKRFGQSLHNPNSIGLLLSR